MRRWTSAALAVGCAAVIGCGSETTVPTAPFTEEQKRAIQEEDQRVYDEEGGPQQKTKAKPRR